jgi:homoserine dehydrogenase
MTADTVRRIRLILVGAGNVGRSFLELSVGRADRLRTQFGLQLVLVGIADTSGVAVCGAGLDPQQVLDVKAAGAGVAAHSVWGQPDVTAQEMVGQVRADLLVEASPVNLVDGQPGLGCIEMALERGMHVVTANKAPLVLAFSRLAAMAEAQGRCLRFDATVAGGLPAVNLGRRDLAAAGIRRLAGVLNLTTNYLLTRMAADGLPFDQALQDMQAAGHAEADPALDVQGWDAANKLVILARSVLGMPATLEDVEVEGIGSVTPALLRRAAAQNRRVKLVACAERTGTGYQLSVRPTWLEPDHPLAQLGPSQMGIVYETDACGTIAASILEDTPMPTAYAVLRDILDIFAGSTQS